MPAEILFLHTHGDEALDRVLDAGLSALRQARASGGVCVVPEGAPLFEDRSALDNVRLLSRLFGRRLSRRDAEYALRCADVPDRVHLTRARALSVLHRLQVWLAVARLDHIHAIVLERPFATLATDEGDAIAAVLREIAATPTKIVVSGTDRSTAERLGAETLTVPVRR